MIYLCIYLIGILPAWAWLVLVFAMMPDVRDMTESMPAKILGVDLVSCFLAMLWPILVTVRILFAIMGALLGKPGGGK